MAFWSGEKLAAELPALIDPYDPTRIDCAAYTLALGPEVFVTTDLRLEDSPIKG
jgi:dCTP deaminase